MKFIGLTQKIEISKYNTSNDVIEQGWYDFFNTLNAIPLLIPNDFNITRKLLDNTNLNGIVLSGGNDLIQFGGTVSKRDKVEQYCIQYSINNNIPIIGVCRGMQMILDFFSVKMYEVEGHVNSQHQINFLGVNRIVNSFHKYACREVSSEFQVLAYSEDGVVEAVKHERYPIFGIMWHPERSNSISAVDQSFFNKVFQI